MILYVYIDVLNYQYEKINNNQEEKNEIIEKYINGISMRKLEKEYNRSFTYMIKIKQNGK